MVPDLHVFMYSEVVVIHTSWCAGDLTCGRSPHRPHRQLRCAPAVSGRRSHRQGERQTPPHTQSSAGPLYGGSPPGKEGGTGLHVLSCRSIFLSR